MREATEAFAGEKKSMKENHTALSLRIAQLSVMPAFLGDPVIQAHKCFDTIMAYLERVHVEKGSRFRVLKGKRADSIFQQLVKDVGPRGIHLPSTEDKAFVIVSSSIFFELGFLFANIHVLDLSNLILDYLSLI